VVSPDYADNVKFADEWLPAQPGTDGALAMAMGHVILREFFVDRSTPRFLDYVKRYTDLPFLVTLEPHGDAPTCRASSSPPPTSATVANTRRSSRSSGTTPRGRRPPRTGRSAFAGARAARAAGT
jgi:nitrate reductase alpha subunit